MSIPLFKKTSLFSIILLTSIAAKAQQIITDDSLTPQELIENNLVFGCVEVSNISSPYNGQGDNIRSFGYFERAGSNFPFENGIILSTGRVNSAGNVLITDRLNEGSEALWTTDPDIETALGITETYNATTIEFDFISGSNTVNFNYIMASEEYAEDFPCDISDGFAFLIRETASTGPYTNIAIIPGTSIPVSTNTVHDEIVGSCPAENEDYFEGYNLGDTNYNGRTTVMTATTTIIPDVQYHIKLVIADQDDFQADSAVFIEGNSFSTDISLGEDISTCDAAVTLNAITNNPNAVYEWYQDGTLLSGETTDVLNVNTSATYRVVISVPLNGTACSFEDEVEVTLNSIQTQPDLMDFELCDDVSNDGTEIFDLTTITDGYIATLPSATYAVSYHLTNIQAVNNENPFTTLSNTISPQIVFARAEDTVSGCVYIARMALIVNPFPIINAPANPIEACDDDGAILSNSDDEITGGNPNYVVTYHNSQPDADTGDNPLASPYTPSSASEQLYIRVIDINSGCATTTNATINMFQSPVLNTELQEIDACEQDDDGIEEFDITSVIDEVLQGITNVTVTYHETQDDANNNTNPIADPTRYFNTQNFVQIVYVRVENNNSSCFSIAPIELHTDLLQTATNLGPFFFECDTAPDDGFADFDLNVLEGAILNGIEDTSVTFYQTEDDQINEVSPLNKNVLYAPITNDEHELFITLTSPICEHLDRIMLMVNPSVTVTDAVSESYCDNDDDQITSIDLTTFDALMAGTNPNPIVEYYESETNAQSGTDQLPSIYENITDPAILYVRVINSLTGCFDVGELIIDVLPAPTVTTPSPFIICDDDQDGFSILNLEDKIAEIVTDTTNRNITFHINEVQAHDESDRITDPANFNANTTTVYVRVENSTTGCYAVSPQEIIINTLPNFPTDISNFIRCETDGDQTAAFIFEEKDIEILNGQTDKEVLYFETEADALSGTATPIDKTAPYLYTNMTPAREIYVRVQNLTDANCFGTDSFALEVGAVPVFTPPNPMDACDDISNDGFHTFDLNEQIDHIIGGRTGLNVQFYLSENEAVTETNPIPDLNYTNTVNPQELFAVIDNNTFCKGIASFRLNVIQVPTVFETSTEITHCDTDLDGQVLFDITTVEAEVLDSRQNNIVITYYPDQINLENETNPITNPASYTNIENPQIAYIHVENTVSNCSVAIPIELIVNLPPRIPAIPEFDVCENSANAYDLTEAIAPLIDGQANVNLTFHATAIDADLNQAPLNTDYTYVSNSDTIFVRSEFNDTGCYLTSAFTLRVNPTPAITAITNLEACDDDFDDQLVFDLSAQTSRILGSLPPTNYTVTYHNELNDALNSENALTDLNVLSENNQDYYIRVENNTTSCFTTATFSTIIHRKPEVEITDQIICLDNLPLSVTAETNVATDRYSWSTGATSSTVNIDAVGTYSVTVTSINNCVTTETFTVSESEKATIEFTETVDFADPNTLTVTVSGIGNYLYQFNDGEPQTSNFFNNVPIGPHTITVIDLNGCNSVSKEITVIDTPKFFSPNGDGHFDTWHITGVSQLKGTTIMIYDRHGKLLKTLGHNTQGWDGTYNGEIMPATDYWFYAKVVNGDINFEVKNHFALRR